MDERIGEQQQFEEQAIIGDGGSLLTKITSDLGIRNKILLGFAAILTMTLIVAVVALVSQRMAGTQLRELIGAESRLAELTKEAQSSLDGLTRAETVGRMMQGEAHAGKEADAAAGQDEAAQPKSAENPLFQEAVRKLEATLKDMEQLTSQEKQRSALGAMTYVIIGATLLAIGLGILLAWIISRGLTSQIDHIMALLGELGIGNFEARTPVVSQDELGVMASSLNAMLDNMTSMIQSQDDQDKQQEAFMKLMGEIDQISDGDLTVRAEVTEDVTGALADSVNTMAEQFGEIVRQVKEASNAVDKTASEVSEQTSELAMRSLEQNEQVNATIAAVHNIAEAIRQVSRNAAQSAEVSETSRANARAGAEAVEQTHRAMDDIREQINETARSIKRLGESSMEIGNVVEIINNIADRTSILALNASIQAAMAGEAGHGFAVVAEEVQRLAESSSNSTKQIDTLIKSIQAEIKDAGNRMDESISKVVQGSQLADGAYAKLQEIEIVSNQLADLIQSISQSAAEQEKTSEDVVSSMVAVGEVSTNTANSSQETNHLMAVLTETAQNLRAAVDTFKIEAAAV